LSYRTNNTRDFSVDTQNQLTTATRSGTLTVAETFVPGQQFEFTFDDIGNRKTAKAGGDSAGANLRSATYTPNLLNQCNGRTVPGGLDVLGIADAGATLTITSPNNGVYRKGQYFRSEVTVANTGGPVWQTLNVTSSGGGAAQTGKALVPKTPEDYDDPATTTVNEGHDADGNLLRDGRWVCTWDAENRLIQQETRADAPAGSKRRLQFEYDFMGRRIKRTVTNLDTSAVEETRYLYDGWNLIAELNPNLTVRRSFVWGLDLSGTIQGAGGVGGLLWVRDHGTGLTHFAAHDGNGNVAALVDAGTGNTTALYEYGPFGEGLRATGAMAKGNPFRFSTKYQDEESDFLYYGYRFYNPSTGRWLNRDPLEEDGGEGIYVFAANNSGNNIDLFGLACSSASSAFSLALKDVTIPYGPFVQFDGSFNLEGKLQGKACDCCGERKTVKAEGAIRGRVSGEWGVTVGKRINKTIIGLNVMGFFGIRLAGMLGGEATGTYRVFCDGTKEAELLANPFGAISGQGGAMFEVAWPKGWPKRLTGPPWGERTGIGALLDAEGKVGGGIKIKCRNDTCSAYLNAHWEASVDATARLGPWSVSWSLWEDSGQTRNIPLGEFSNPFN